MNTVLHFRKKVVDYTGPEHRWKNNSCLLETVCGREGWCNLFLLATRIQAVAKLPGVFDITHAIHVWIITPVKYDSLKKHRGFNTCGLWFKLLDNVAWWRIVPHASRIHRHPRLPFERHHVPAGCHLMRREGGSVCPQKANASNAAVSHNLNIIEIPTAYSLTTT